MSIKTPHADRTRTRDSRDPADAPPVGSVHLDGGQADRDGQQSLHFEQPHATHVLSDARDLGSYLDTLTAELHAGRHIAGFFTYEAGRPLVGVGPRASHGPLAWFGVYDTPKKISHPQALPENAESERPTTKASLGVQHVDLPWDQKTWSERVERVQGYLRSGDTYQVNLTLQADVELSGAPFAAYRKLLAHHPVPYAAYIRPDADRHILSLSPELFVRSDGRDVWSRPMKGTAGPADSAAALHDEKTKAEHIMIVDLLRNDLGRVCEAGSVHVPHLFDQEPYATVRQLTSTVRGRLTRDGDPNAWADVMRALLPCGSITGAPKRRTMEIIDELEDGPRGVYTGAMGYAAPDGTFAFNVPIRTLDVQGRTGRMGLGCGIVIDSDAAAEYRELKLKAAFTGAFMP